MNFIQKLSLAAAVAAFLAPVSTLASTPAQSGWYVGAGAMGTYQTEAESKGYDATSESVTDKLKYQMGWGFLGNGGYAWGNGIRTEAEVAHRRSKLDKPTGYGAGPIVDAGTGELLKNGGKIYNTSLMGNVFYDFTTGTRLTPYIGVGIGASVVDADGLRTINYRTLDSTRVQFAYQGIVGFSTALDTNWDLTTDYRYFRTTNPHFKTNMNDRADTENASHNIVVGLRYTFDEAKAPAPMPKPVPVARPVLPAPAPVAAPVIPEVPQSFMVFFDFDRAILTPEARRILAAAAKEFQSGKYVRVVVTGHTDTMGTSKYNQKLSVRRALAVQMEMKQLGVSAAVVDVNGMGKSSLLVPTADGVREAQNRRAEIILKK